MKDEDKKAMYYGFCISKGYSELEAVRFEKEIKDSLAYAFYDLKYSLVNLGLAFLEMCVKAYEEQEAIKKEMEGKYLE